ncbi:ribosomal protein S6 kinase-related protein-like isoform X2 [Tachypleus tridentatus]|uniref:ribosomal protein S6 kinase-related protein-like isoform X2 n=1 Tax=Tachypleus tridentatus TaxID=6853 RepID=UPI003FCEF618
MSTFRERYGYRFSFSSVHSGQSVSSVQRPWSRTSRRRWQQSTSGNQYEATKTTWPVALVEAMFLPEFPVRGALEEQKFQVKEQIAQGAFGSVLLVQQKDSEHVYAMKVLSKAQVIMQNAVQQCKDEVTIQCVLGHHPFIVKCKHHWQNKKKLFIVTEYIPHGELLKVWKTYGKFNEELVQFYVAELALTIDFLHNAGVIYRDLKMENILLDEKGHVQLIDFGLAKWLAYGERANTICGTIQYMAPEILKMESYTKAVDWWSLGIIMYALLTGQYPVESVHDHSKMQKLVESTNYTLPESYSDGARHVVRQLLCKLPQRRLQSLHALKSQPFFRNMNFDEVFGKKVSLKELFEKNIKDQKIISASSAHSNDSELAVLEEMFEDFPHMNGEEVT